MGDGRGRSGVGFVCFITSVNFLTQTNNCLLGWGELGGTSNHESNERSGWSWEVLECESVGRCGCAEVWGVGGTGCSSSVLGSGVLGRQRREECRCTMIPARGVAMQVNGIEECGLGWCGCECGFVLLMLLCCVRFLCSSFYSML